MQGGRTWKDWTRTDWHNAVYCDTCGLPMLEVADMDAKIVADVLRRHVTEGVLMAHDVKLAEWLAVETDPPNWVRMIAGANPEVFDDPDLYDALIEEVKAQME